jgi:hypothetical protein
MKIQKDGHYLVRCLGSLGDLKFGFLNYGWVWLLKLLTDDGLKKNSLPF